MNPAELAVVIAIGLFVGMAVCLEVGYRLGNYASRKTETAHEGTGTIEAAIFALLGLLLGFTFANGMSHLDQRRQLIVQESPPIDSGKCASCFANISTRGWKRMRSFPI
jgi:hypothetical protein